MKRILILFSLFFGLCACENDATIRVGSYNLWVTHIGKGDYAWSERAPRLAQSIADMDLDIFGAQEVDTLHQRQLPQMINELSGTKYDWKIFSPYAEDGGVGNKAQAIIYKAERFEILEDHHFWFSETPEVMSSGWDEMKFKRGGFCLTMLDKNTGRKLFVMHSHMPLGRIANKHAADILVEKAKQYNPEGLPAFFIGDLNTTPDSPSSLSFRDYWTDSFLVKYPQINGPLGTFHAAKNEMNMNAARRIDYIYYRGEDVECKDYNVWTKMYDGFYPSDHCAVFCNFIIK